MNRSFHGLLTFLFYNFTAVGLRVAGVEWEHGTGTLGTLVTPPAARELNPAQQGIVSHRPFYQGVSLLSPGPSYWLPMRLRLLTV